MWTVLYIITALIFIWLLARLMIWQVARWVKTKFDVDVAIRSIGLFCVNDVTVRVNQLQTIEIDKVSLHLKLFRRDAVGQLVSLRFGELRVRGEVRTSERSTPSSLVNSAKTHRRSNSVVKRTERLVKILSTLFKHVSLHVDMLNVMVLHAFVPDSLLHISIQSVHLLSDKSMRNANREALAASLSVQSIDGKILKSPKEASEVTSCIAELATTLDIAVVIDHFAPFLQLNSIDIDFSKLQLDIHEGALIPGILLPKITQQLSDEPTISNSSNVVDPIEQFRNRFLNLIQLLPFNSTMCIRSFGVAFFGDETMGETTRGAHVCSGKILLKQFKDTDNMVPVVIEKIGRSEFKAPSGYIRLLIEDVTMTDYYKHKVADMGKTIFESKLTVNGVLSNSLDLTSWHADYIHKEAVDFWSIIFKKLQDARQQRALLDEALQCFPPRDGTSASSSRNKRRARVASAPDSVYNLNHPDILKGTEDAALSQRNSENQPQHSLNLSEVFGTVEISMVFECTVYDASIDVIMIPSQSNGIVSDQPPSFTIGLDSFTGSVDQSPHSRDFNFMSKLESFWCSISQDDETLICRRDQDHGKNGVHQWGRAFNIESLRVHGSANFKVTPSNESQEISFLIDAKVAGLQLEASQRAAQALASVLYTVVPVNQSHDKKHALRRQMTTPTDYGFVQQPQVQVSAPPPKYRYKLACLELELNKVNGFILSSDKLSCGDCFVARFDQVKMEFSGSNSESSNDDDAGIVRSVDISGVAITTVHNPAFSPFATYEAGFAGPPTPSSKLPSSVRQLQTRASVHRCVEAAYITPNHISFDILEVHYSTKYLTSEEFDDERNGAQNVEERIRRQLSITLTAESDMAFRWTPSLHALVHYELTDCFTILAPFFGKKHSPTPPPFSYSNVPFIENKPYSGISNHGDHPTPSRSQNNPIKVKMFGDGHNPRYETTRRPLQLDVNISSVKIHFCLTEKQSIMFSLSPLRCLQDRKQTGIKFDELLILMDGNLIFDLSNTAIELSNSSSLCDQERKMFPDLITAENRAWSFDVASAKCTFPHKYDFAATFDLCVTNFKWVKGLYRKTSHPFRSPRLPPDLVINIGQFSLEIADWDFECHLHDNHELMKDEWEESEKRRRVLDQRMVELRKARGELLPAKKVEELYCRLEEENTKIYLSRSRDLHGAHGPPGFALLQRQTSAESRRFRVYSAGQALKDGRMRNVLFSWKLTDFSLTVMADASMHGMQNALNTIKSIDNVSPFPFEQDPDGEPKFTTLWCRTISLFASKHQVRIRNYPQCLMDFSDWKIFGKFCGAEQTGLATAKRTEYVHLPAPWGRAEVKRNMPALKFYHDLKSEVQTFNMAWGPCWDAAWAQVNLAFNLLTKSSIDPSPLLPWWDKSRLLYHGTLSMQMDRVNLLHLASLDPYNTTEHMHWDWKNLKLDWTPGCFLFVGDLDIHIRNASKYDDIRFLHLPHLKMQWSFDWICLNGANPHNHHVVMPSAPDKIDVNDLPVHDTFRYFRSRDIDLSIDLDTNYKPEQSDDQDGAGGGEDVDKPEILLYSTTLRWLSNFWYAVNAVARPVCKGPIFGHVIPPKLKLSRHYKNVKVSFEFPQLKACYWSSYNQQLGIEWICGAGKVASHFRLRIIPLDGPLLRRSLGEWSVVSTRCDLSHTKIYLLKRQEVDEVSQSASSKSLGVERNFMLSLSKMFYHRASVADSDGPSSPTKPGVKRSESTLSRASANDYDDIKQRKKRAKKTSSPTKRPQNRQTLVVHDLRAMWTTDNRDVGYGLYEGYNKAAVLRRNLSTKIFSKFAVGSGRESDSCDGNQSRKLSQVTPTPDGSSVGGFSQKTMDPNLVLHQLLSEQGDRFVVGAEEYSTEQQQQLRGVSACDMDDVINRNWHIKFFNCQAMLKGPKTQGYIIMTAAEADFLNREHRVSWRDGQLTTKSSWVGSLTGTQLFATVERNVTSSGQDGENVPWLAVSDIVPRGPSPGMLDITDLMGGGQAIGGVVGDGVSAGSFQLQRIVSRCTCQMFYVGYEALVDSEQSDYAKLLPETPVSPEDDKAHLSKGRLRGHDLLGKEKPVNVLTVLQPELEICTNTSQFTMIIDIVENLLLYVEPNMKEHWEKVDRIRFKLRLTSAQDALKHRGTLAAMQSRVRTQLTNMRQLERQLFRADRELDNDPLNNDLVDECNELRERLAEDKETLNIQSEELGIMIRCFKELFLEQKTRSSSLRPQNQRQDNDEDEASLARTTEVSLGRVKWNLTDEDGQLNLAQFEMKEFLYEKVNRSDDSVAHCFELGWLCVLNLLPNSQYRDVIKPRHPAGLRSYGVSGAGGRSLILRVLCKVRPPVGGISVKDHVEVNAAPLSIQLTYQFFRRMMRFFFPDKGNSSALDDDDNLMGLSDARDNKSATLLGLSTGGLSQQDRYGSLLSLPSRPPPPPSPSTSHSQLSTPGSLRKNRSSTKRADAFDDVDKMKERAANNNSFLYIKITQVPLCVSYKGEKEKNLEDVHEFDLTIPMLEYHSMTWTWHDFAMAVKRDCKKQLVSQLIKKKLHIIERSHSHSTTGGASELRESAEAMENNKARLLLGNTIQRSESSRKSLFRKKK